MPHFAKLDENNIVITVLAGSDSDDGKEGEVSARTGETYKQTNYNTLHGEHLLGETPYRKNYAGIGYSYDESRDAFIPPKPYNSWTLTEATCQWEAPTAYPDDGKMYNWNEDTTSWDEIS
tara:strand:- start:656 stop:1015 length:360 start_codon:yes stop_codon:yes gene_type:complete